MTRINVGVRASELCDQHLVAEYRELPRLWGMTSKTTPPTSFKLGRGHVLWCAQYQGMLHDRYVALVAEMHARGMRTTYPRPPAEAAAGRRPAAHELTAARVLVLERIEERLRTMRRPPRWTRPDC